MESSPQICSLGDQEVIYAYKLLELQHCFQKIPSCLLSVSKLGVYCLCTYNNFAIFDLDSKINHYFVVYQHLFPKQCPYIIIFMRIKMLQQTLLCPIPHSLSSFLWHLIACIPKVVHGQMENG